MSKLKKNNVFSPPYDEDCWHKRCGREKREKQKKKTMKISGRSVFEIKRIINKKALEKGKGSKIASSSLTFFGFLLEFSNLL